MIAGKHWRLAAWAASIAVAVSVSGCSSAMAPAGVPAAPGTPSVPVGGSKPTTPPGQGGSVPPGQVVSEAKSPVKAGVCSPDAAVTPKATDSKQRQEALANREASKRHGGPPALPDTASAIAQALHAAASPEEARALGWKGSPFANPRAAAVSLPYAAVGRSLGGDDTVSPQRCVWVVTVQEPYVAKYHPKGVTPPVYDEYTMVIDQASGEGLALAAGPDTPNAITGDGLEEASG